MRTAMLVGLFLVACTELESPVTEEAQTAGGIPYFGPAGYYEEDMQGRWLLGQLPDAMTNLAGGADHFSVLPPAGTTASVVNGVLTIRSNNSAVNLQGIGLTSASGVVLQIDGVSSAPPRYHLRIKTGNSYAEYCKDGASAVAMQGIWTSTAAHDDGVNITFGCEDGVTAKCFTWGYVPGVPGSLDWRAHTACTRMARADFCGNAEPHTREMTPIVIRDYIAGHKIAPTDAPVLIHATSQPPPIDRYFFEAAWNETGAVCLEKQRWASLPVGTSCPNLHDPRVTPLAVDPRALYCRELAARDWLGSAPLLANASGTYDVYLQRWRHPGTGDVVSTARGFYSERVADNAPPLAGYQWLKSDGVILRNPPGSLTKADLVPVFSTTITRTAGPDLVLTTNDALQTTDPAFEGYLLKYQGGDRQPFYRHQRTIPAVGGPIILDELTSIDLSVPGFDRKDPLFYVIKP